MTLRKCLGMLMLVVSGWSMGQAWNGTDNAGLINHTGQVNIGDPNAANATELRFNYANFKGFSMNTYAANCKLAVYDNLAQGSPRIEYGLGYQANQFRFHLGGQANDRFSFFSGSTTFGSSAGGTELMTLSGTGRLGVGAPVPEARLHLVTTTASATPALKLQNTTGGGKVGIDFQPWAQTNMSMCRVEAVDMGACNAALAFSTTDIADYAGGTNCTTIAPLERMRINSRGYVGIGTTAPTSLLNLYGNNVDARLDITSSNAASGNAYTQFNNKFIVGTGGSNFNGAGSNTSGWLMLGGVNNNTSGRLWMNTGAGVPKVVFGNSPDLAASSSTLSGTFIFDGQTSSRSLLLADPAATAPTIPSGYKFYNQGHTMLTGNLMVTSQGAVQGAQYIQISHGISAGYITTVGSAKPMLLNSDGVNYVGIGFNNNPSTPGPNLSPDYKLRVKGKIVCEELKVQLSGSWPDYVFDKDYKLASLDSVETYINENKHLPEVPSAADIKENGIETGQMNAILLKKVEELTLYMIQQQKEIEALKMKNAEIEKQLKN